MTVDEFIQRVRHVLRIHDDRIQDIEIVHAGRQAQETLHREGEQAGIYGLTKVVWLENQKPIPDNIQKVIRCINDGVYGWYIDSDPVTEKRMIVFYYIAGVVSDSVSAPFEVTVALTPIPNIYSANIDVPDYAMDRLITLTAQILSSRLITTVKGANK